MIYTIAIGPGFAAMARLALEGILRHTQDRVVIFTDQPERLSDNPRVKQHLVRVDSRAESMRLKYRARHFLRPDGWEPVTFLDADMVLRGTLPERDNPAPDIQAYESPWNYPMTSVFHAAYLTAEEMETIKRTGLNAGLFTVKGLHYHATMERWEAIDATPRLRENQAIDQPAWNRLILDLEAEGNRTVATYKWPAQIFHAIGGAPEAKLERMREALG